MDRRPRKDSTSPVDERLATPLLIARDAMGLDRPAGDAEPGEGEVIGESMARFLPVGVRSDDLPVSFALVRARPARGNVTDGFSPRPLFGHCVDGRWFAEIPIEAGTTLHGVGMQAHGIERSGRRYICWNTDYAAYSPENPGLYQSHPWVLAVRADGTSFGVLADTTWRTEVDLRDPSRIRFRTDGPAFPVYVLQGETPQDVCRRLADLTGRMALPPRWALGYHQCRWSYLPAGRALRIAEEFRRRSIPCDVIWFDIHYMDDYRIFTFNKHRFPDPASLNDRLHSMGFKTVWMIDPAPQVNESFDVYATGKAGDHFVHDSRGGVFEGEVWPGPCAFPDFTRPETCRWWGDLYEAFIETGVDGVWNDMNEPSVFDETSKTMPETCWHRGGGDLPAAPHAMYHNVYGMLMVQASRDGIASARPEKRPFVLTRSNFIGGHRYAATWTGDNSANWRDLRLSVPMVVNLGLSGQAFSGPDIGGFADHSEGDPELFARWMALGAFLPFMRAHVAHECVDKEPWALGEECENACRSAIELRYRLLPYLYTLFHRASTTGEPIVAPVFFADPQDSALRDEDRMFLLGDDVLVRHDPFPAGEIQAPALPAGAWHRLVLEQLEPAGFPEVFVRGGAIVPLGPVMQHSGAAPLDPLTLVVAPDADGLARGLLYEDEGDGNAHQAGVYRLTTYAARDEGGTCVLFTDSVEGAQAAPERTIQCSVLGDGAERAGAGTEGREIRIG